MLVTIASREQIGLVGLGAVGDVSVFVVGLCVFSVHFEHLILQCAPF